MGPSDCGVPQTFTGAATQEPGKKVSESARQVLHPGQDVRWETRKRAGVVIADGTPGGLPGSGDFYQGISGSLGDYGARVKSVGALEHKHA